MADPMHADVAVSTPMTGDTAAAILLTLLGDNEAAAILSGLNPDEAKRLGVAMLDVARSSVTDVECALDMFVNRSRGTISLGIGADARVRSVFSTALGQARADTILDDIAPTTASALVEKLRWTGTDILTDIFKAEHPQVSALILAHLTAETAAAVLTAFDDAKQADLIYRAAVLSHVSLAAFDELVQIIESHSADRTKATLKLDCRSDLAKIVTHLPAGANQRVLKHLKKRDKILGQEIEDEMFVFDELCALDAKAMGILLRSIDSQILTLALRGATPEMVNQMLACLSSRAADTIRDEMADGAAVKRVDVESAQKEIATTARRLAEDGDISLGRKSGDYV